MKIVVPSYHRAELFKKKTLKYLLYCGVPLEEINVFVVEEDYEKYKALWVNVIIGKRGIGNQRKFISEYYPEGEYIASFDDDLDCIYERASWHRYRANIYKVIEDAIEEMEKHKLALCGVRPSSNILCVRHLNADVWRCFVIWAFFVAKNDRSIYTKHTAKEDYDRCAQHRLKYWATIRMNKYMLNTKYNSWEAWGLNDYYKSIDMNKHNELLCQDYPQFFKTHRLKSWRIEIQVIPEKKNGEKCK